MAGSRPTIEGTGASVEDPIKVGLSDDEGDTKQAWPLVYGENNAGRPPETPRRRRPQGGLVLHTVGESASVPPKGVISARRWRSSFVYKLRPKTPTAKKPTAPRTGELPELPVTPPPRLRPLPRPPLLQQLLRLGSKVSVSEFGFLTWPLQYRLSSARVQPINQRAWRAAAAVTKASFDALAREAAIAQAPGPIVPGPIVVEETRKLTYVAWGRPDEIRGSGILLRNEPVGVTVTRLGE
ncbi:hypothetical protein FRC09_020888 [Ceratobasidium sp. 395]|nr:hypothetical protein FRC09_020888 [Ceratobasidium sp. 395]